MPFPVGAQGRTTLTASMADDVWHLPAPRRTPPPIRRHSLRRRASDAGARTRPDGRNRSCCCWTKPSLGLAPKIVADIFRVVGALRDRGIAILLVEQNARAALQVADYGYVLEMGRVALQGPCAALAEDARVIETYLGRKRETAARWKLVTTSGRELPAATVRCAVLAANDATGRQELAPDRWPYLPVTCRHHRPSRSRGRSGKLDPIPSPEETDQPAAFAFQ